MMLTNDVINYALSHLLPSGNFQHISWEDEASLIIFGVNYPCCSMECKVNKHNILCTVTTNREQHDTLRLVQLEN